MRSATVGGTTTTYTHDGDGNRLSATTSGATTAYLWDVNGPLPRLALERTGGSTIRAYSHGAGLNSMSTGGSNHFYLLDAYAGVANLTSPSGATEWTYQNDPFGTGTATKNDPGAPANVMRFDGQFLDPATGLYNLRARTYDAGLGRFLQIDPLAPSMAEPYTASYVYADDRPTVFSDPSGQGFIDTLKEAVFHFGSSYNAGSDELYADWQAGPTEPKIVGGVMIAAGGLGLLCAGAFEACYAVMSSPIGVSFLNKCAAEEGAAALDATPAGRIFSAHYLDDTGPIRNIPGSVVDEVIDHGQVLERLADRTIYYDAVNDVTVVQSETTGRIMSVRRGMP